jgi:hypothetical protein
MAANIKKGDVNFLENYLNHLDNNPEEISVDSIEWCLSNALVYKNNIMVSMINNFIREHKIPTTKEGISKNIFFTEPH